MVTSPCCSRALGASSHEQVTDQSIALKKKHSKTGDDSKYHATILGRGNDVGEVQVEGGPDVSIADWISKRSATLSPSQEEQGEEKEEEHPQTNGHLSDDDSNLSSVGDRLENEDEMDLS